MATKKAFVSGHNYIQDIHMEPGVYTVLMKVKSMYGDVCSFALFDGTTWTHYDMDTVQGQWKWAYVTFRTLVPMTKINLISRNYSAGLPVYVVEPQIVAGNVPVEAGASPFDIDMILNDLHDGIDGIEDFTNEAFADGLLNREEKTQLRASLDAIGAIVESVKGSYNKLLDNPFIHEDTMMSISTRYYAFIASWISDGDPRGLKPVILWIVNGDNIISQNERDEKDRALNAFNDALYAYNQAEKEVYNDVGASIDKVQADANTSLAKTKFMTEIDGGLIYSAMMKLYDAGGTGDEMAGISGIAGDNKEDPAFWAGGTYDQAIGGTAKAIIRHDGTSKFTDTDITGRITATSGTFKGRITATSGTFKGRIESAEGNIGGMEISGDTLVSQNGRVVVDGVNNAVYLLDESGSIKTALRPDDLPSLSSYFSSAISREIAVAPIAGNYIESYPTRSSTSVSLPNGFYEAIIPAMTLKAFATSTSSLGGGVSMRVDLVGGGNVFSLGTVSAWASGTNSDSHSDSHSSFFPKRTIALNKGGSYYLKATLTNDSIGGSYASGSGEVLVSNNLVINQVVNRSEIGNNGMMIATSKTRYDYMVGGTSEIRRGDYILKVTEDGIQKSSNGGSNWDFI